MLDSSNISKQFFYGGDLSKKFLHSSSSITLNNLPSNIQSKSVHSGHQFSKHNNNNNKFVSQFVTFTRRKRNSSTINSDDEDTNDDIEGNNNDDYENENDDDDDDDNDDYGGKEGDEEGSGTTTTNVVTENIITTITLPETSTNPKIDPTETSTCVAGSPQCNQCSSTNEFLCISNGQCLPISVLCDGQINCDDNSDEENCSISYITTSNRGKFSFLYLTESKL